MGLPRHGALAVWVKTMLCISGLQCVCRVVFGHGMFAVSLLLVSCVLCG